MNEFDKKDLEKLEQEQLINNILSRQKLETDALIQAAKENPKQSQESVEKRKEEILSTKLKQQEEANKKQLEERKKLLESVEKDLAKWNEEKRKEEEERSKKVNQILQEMDFAKNKKTIRLSETQKARERLEAYDREKFRRKFNKTYNKKLSFLEQLKKEKDNEREASQDIIKQPPSDKKEQPLSNKKEKFSITNTPSKITHSISEKETLPKKTISSFKRLVGVKIYQQTMDFYERSKIKHLFDVTIGTKPNTLKDKRASFAQKLHSAVNEKEANTKATSKQRPHYEPRYL